MDISFQNCAAVRPALIIVEVFLQLHQSTCADSDVLVRSGQVRSGQVCL